MSTITAKGPIFDPGLCRCCGSMKKCRLLNVEYESLGQKEIYSDMIMDCFGLVLSYLDGKPTERLICATCVTRLREACTFRRQVLYCEEAFLQMKMDDAEFKDTGQTEVLLQSGSKMDFKVKIELEELVESPTHDSLEDSHMDYDAQDDLPLSHCVKESVNTTELTPSCQLVKSTQKPLKKVEHSIKPQIKGGLKIKLKKNGKVKSDLQVVKIKNDNMQMSKLQQLMRERDPTYLAETNILAIVEYSYACPFKCRHNHLLCYYCGEHFLDPCLLRDHTQKFHHPKKFKVIEHKKMIKIDLTRIDCRLCPIKIDNIEHFKEHITSVHKKKYYFDFKDLVLPFRLTKDVSKCALCDEVFPYFHALNKHMNKHFRNYVCETCGLGFVDKGRFMMHQMRHEEGDFPCQICGKGFKAQYNRELHIDRVHNKRGRVYCPKCDVKLMSYHQKCKHLVEVHGEEPMSFPCNLCEKVCETRRMLTIHLRKDHLKDYRYNCPYCGQKFFTRFALNNHTPTHTGERNFKCKVCEKSYPRLKTLKDHMRIHTNDRRYRCHICGQAFIQNCSLKGHMKSQHPEYG